MNKETINEINNLIREAHSIKLKSSALLLENLYEPLFLYTYELIRDQSQAKDIVQETFSYLIENNYGIFQFNNYQEIYNDLLKFTKQACINYIHEKENYKEYDQKISELSNITDDEVYNKDKADMLKALKEIYDTLPEERQELLKQQYIEGATPDEIAANFKITKQSLFSINYRSLKILLHALTGE